MVTISSPSTRQAILAKAQMGSDGSSEGKIFPIGTGETSDKNSRLLIPTGGDLVLSC